MGEAARAARNLAWADALVEGLIAGGVGHAVVAPGSRSTPLVLALSRRPGIEITVLPDERSAAFFALGLGRGTGRPALFVCTSGSAAANGFPAVLEASMDGVPLIVLSADRPAELQHTGANQTLDQLGLFGAHVRACVALPAPDDEAGPELPRSVGLRAVERARWPHPGPVHLNLAFREPLVPDEPAPVEPAAFGSASMPPSCLPDPAVLTSLAQRVDGRPGLIVCGRGLPAEGFASAVSALAARLGAPILADPLSGLRWGGHDRRPVLTAYDLFLRGRPPGATLAPAWVLQFGATPVSAVLDRYLATCGAPRFLVGTAGDWQDPSRRAAGRILADDAALAEVLLDRDPAPAPPEWQAAWQAAEDRGAALTRDPSLRPPEAAVVEALESALGADASLFVGNSMPIRAVDAFARGRSAKLAVYGNRGLSGIDGNVSTALGLGRGADARVTALIGDLTLYHDMNGLLAAREVAADFIVLDNGGGGIFALMPQAGLPEFERLWLTPTGLAPERVAALYGLAYERIAAPAELGEALAGGEGSRLVHVMLDRDDSVQRFRRLWDAAAALGANEGED